MNSAANMNNVAVIPARAGSKRIPKKNIKSFLGRPIIEYAIENAFASGLFDEIMVSTDSEEIAEIAQNAGANVPFLRSEKKSDDYTSVFDVIDEVLQNYADNFNLTFQNVCLIYPTTPLVSHLDLQTGYRILQETGVDQVFPVVEFSYPIWRGLKRPENGTASMKWPEFAMSRSQDLEKIFHDAGQWYWFKASTEQKQNFCKKNRTVILPEIRVQDIDSIEDWEIATLKYEYLKKLAN